MTDLSWLSMQPPPDSAPRADTQSSFRWATVEQTVPLMIRLDGETAPLPESPQTLVGNLAVGRRVWVQLHGRMAVVVGAASTDTGRVTDFGNIGTVLWVRDVNGNLYGDTYWRVADGWATCFVTLSAPGDRTIGSSLVAVATSGFRPPQNAFGIWRCVSSPYATGIGLFNPAGTLYIRSDQPVQVLFEQKLEFRLTPLRMDD